MAIQGDDGHLTHLAPRHFSVPILACSSLGHEENLATLVSGGAPREAAQYEVNLAGKRTQNTDPAECHLPYFQAFHCKRRHRGDKQD